jgi:hypothetical protein
MKMIVVSMETIFLSKETKYNYNRGFGRLGTNDFVVIIKENCWIKWTKKVYK